MQELKPRYLILVVCIVAYWIKLPPAVPVFHMGTGSINLLLTGFDLAQPQLLWKSGEWTRKEEIFLSVSPSL